jgi:hypothetical protein
MKQVFPNGWLAFELGVLRRLKFSCIAFPFTGEPELGMHLKRWKVRVAANDPMIWSYTKATALLENYSERLNPMEIDSLVDDLYLPREQLTNPSLLKWFNETDASWFDNLRLNVEQLPTDYKRALALTIGMMVGDYVLSFDEETRQLRQPLYLSNVFKHMAEVLPYPYDNTLTSKAFHQDTRTFLAERQHTDLLFLRLPAPVFELDPLPDTSNNWREEWLRGSDYFWFELESKREGHLGSRVQSKQQYLGFVDDVLRTAAHIPSWAIAHTDNGFITTEELGDHIGRLRNIEAIYTKDFSDMLGVRTSIVTAVS